MHRALCCLRPPVLALADVRIALTLVEVKVIVAALAECKPIPVAIGARQGIAIVARAVVRQALTVLTQMVARVAMRAHLWRFAVFVLVMLAERRA
jgi:hypothetical protein